MIALVIGVIAIALVVASSTVLYSMVIIARGRRGRMKRKI